MASDGLIFEVTWTSAFNENWTIGKGQAVDGRFQYHAGPMTNSERMSLDLVWRDFFEMEESSDDRPTIVAKSREHLDQLIRYLYERIQVSMNLQCVLNSIDSVSGDTLSLVNILDLNFIDVSNVTDMSNLFANFDVSPHPERGWFCKIKIDVSRWNVSNVTKMSNLFDSKRVNLVGFSEWDRSKVTDC